MALDGASSPGVPEFGLAFLAVALISIVAAPLALMMPRDAASDLSGHHRQD
jgi:hypothetical protein